MLEAKLIRPLTFNENVELAILTAWVDYHMPKLPPISSEEMVATMNLAAAYIKSLESENARLKKLLEEKS